MGWIYFRESVESDLHSNLGCEPLHIVNKTDMHKAFYCPECNQVKLIELPSGTTLQPSEPNCCRGSTSSSEDSPAKTSALQDLEKAWQESEAVYSSRLSVWSKKSSPLSSSWKTSQPLELEVFLKSSMPLQKSGMIVGGLVYLPQMLEPLTREKDGFSWPTPCARDWKDSMSKEKARGQFKKRDSPSLSLTIIKDNGGQLNPQWVEWLMGYPIGHTELNAWATAWFRSKSGKRSKGSLG
jgi:hypothetical protein